MSKREVNRRGAHFATPEYEPSKTPYWVCGGIAAFVVGLSVACGVKIISDNEPTPHHYRMNDADAYGVGQDIEGAALGLRFVVESLKERADGARQINNIAGCERAKASLHEIAPGQASAINCQLPVPQP